MPLDQYGLATVDVPDDPQARARFDELVRPGGVELAPSSSYEATDQTGCVTVEVDPSAQVTGVRLRSKWSEQVHPEALPRLVYDTYVTAIQRAMAVEFTHRAEAPAPAPAEDRVDAGLPLDQWVARTRARLDAIQDEYAAIQRQPAPAPQQDSAVRSPSGVLTLHLHGGSAVGLTGDVQAQGTPVGKALATDFQRLFAAAGLGVDPGEDPVDQPQARRPRRTGGGPEDDDYFGDFNIMGSVD